MKIAKTRNKEKEVSLTPLEQKIYFAAKEAKDSVITLEIIKSWKLADDKTLRLIVHNMQKKRWLMGLKRGVYLVTDPSEYAIPDPFIVSTYLFDGYNAFSSALYIHKLTDMVPFNVYVATKNKKQIKIIGEYSFEALPLGKRAFGSCRFNNYVVSNIPKTIYDCLHKPLLAGGLRAVLKAIYEANMKNEEWKEFLYYAKIEKNAFYQRLGYLLDILPKKSPPIKEIINLCKKYIHSITHLLGRSSGKYIKKWKIIDNVGKEKLLSWWYHG